MPDIVPGALARLDKVADCLIAGDSVPPTDGVWFGLALREFLLGNEPSIERSLGLSPAGVTRAAMRKRSLRNPLIREARDRFYAGRSLTVAAAAIARDWRRYENGGWKADRGRGPMPPGYASTLREYHWRLLSAGFGALSRRQVWNVLAEMQSDPPPNCIGTLPTRGETHCSGEAENV